MAGQNGAIPPGPGRFQAAEYRNSIRSRPRAGRESRSPASAFPIVFSLLCDGTGRFAPCYLAQPLHEQFIASDRYSALSCLKPECGEARVPLLAGDNRENSGFGEIASGARREADRIDFLSRRASFDALSRLAMMDSVETRHAQQGETGSGSGVRVGQAGSAGRSAAHGAGRSSAMILPSLGSEPGATSATSPRSFVSACRVAATAFESASLGLAVSASASSRPARPRAAP